jgi:hypothetical protein
LHLGLDCVLAVGNFFFLCNESLQEEATWENAHYMMATFLDFHP